MNAFVALTDRDWFDFLAAQPDVDEVSQCEVRPPNSAGDKNVREKILS
jgi:hypothetical protein